MEASWDSLGEHLASSKSLASVPDLRFLIDTLHWEPGGAFFIRSLSG